MGLGIKWEEVLKREIEKNRKTLKHMSRVRMDYIKSDYYDDPESKTVKVLTDAVFERATMLKKLEDMLEVYIKED